MIKSVIAAAAVVFAWDATASAQPSALDAHYDAEIPDTSVVLGHGFGEEITTPENAIDYLRALEAAAPDRVRVIDYATSWEGRTLAYAVIAKPETLARLDSLKDDLARLADPRGLDDTERDRLIAETPAVVWLSYGVHGDEISSTDAGLRTAYHLLAALDDPTVEMILENTVIIVDPTQNPDGRARFVHSFTAARGLVEDESRFSAEHDQPWPGGRVNHYLFDMNRDWFVMSQPESQGRVREMQIWNPVVVVDAHEMGGDNTYFFAPSAEPFNPHIANTQRQAQDLIGRNHARWFDQLGYDYFTREVYDAFYPGYGDMWPTLHGAVAMTYEQASARGLKWRQRDGDLLTYGDGVDHHFVSSISTAEVVAGAREQFVRNYVEFRAAAASDTSGPQAVLLDIASNRWSAERLARNLAAQGIEVGRIDGAASACGARFQDGAFLIRLDQPAGRLARTLLESDTELPQDFMDEQEDRRSRGLDHELYDVTAWSLPLMYNVASTECRRAPQVELGSVSADDPMPSSGNNSSAAWGYAVAWTDAGQARFVAALAANGVASRSSDEAFRIGSQNFPRGSVVIPRHGARDDLDALMTRLAAESGARFVGLSSSWVDEGPNPGSTNFNAIHAPRIAMAWGDGTSPTSAGATRYVLEQRYGLPVTVIRTARLAGADLSGFDVLILPEQGRSQYTGELGTSGSANISRFVRNGGVLVGLGNATRWLASSGVGLIAAQRERAADGELSPSPEGQIVAGTLIDTQSDLATAQSVRGAMPDSSPGALAHVDANTNAWMSSGYDNGASVMVTGSDIYTPVTMDNAQTAMSFASPDDLVEAGYLWEENAAQMAFKPYLISTPVGAGQVIAFTQAPTTRAYLQGLDLLLLNAVILGPAHSRALR
jgi:hypothetical protein